MRTFERIGFALIFVVLVAAGCSDGPGGDVASGPAAVSVARDAGRGVRIGLSMKTLNAPYFVAQVNAARARAEDLGAEFVYAEAQDDIVKQIATVEDLLAQGIDLLILNPKDPQGLISATKAATEAGVPVIVIDSLIDSRADFVTNVLSDNLRNGELIGEWVVKEMGDAPIKMALLSGLQGNPVGKERRQGVFRGIIEQQLRSEGQSGFEIVAHGWGNWTHEGGLTAMEDMLVAHPEINVMLAENDSMALGAFEAIREAGRETHILIVAAADGQKEALKLIKDGAYGATGLNDPVLVAETAVEIGLRVLNGETGFPQITYTPAVCVTIHNVDEYYDPNAVF